MESMCCYTVSQVVFSNLNAARNLVLTLLYLLAAPRFENTTDEIETKVSHYVDLKKKKKKLLQLLGRSSLTGLSRRWLSICRETAPCWG